jgi:putative acetyltransferase
VDSLEAQSPEDLAAIRQLFIEYAEYLGVDLCFQSFNQELAGLPGAYSPPDGRLLLAVVDRAPAGCVALRKLELDIGEMKRLYVRPPQRRRGLGRGLAEAVIREARRIGYRRIRLDTLRSLKEAGRLYRALGFVEIPPYTHNPIPDAVFMELFL